MRELIDNHLLDIRDYCNYNNIEYVFAAIDNKNKHKKVSTNVVTNPIIKRVVTIVKKLL